MKKFLLVTSSLIALGAAAPAVAADLAARPYTKAPPMVAAVYDWTGFYIGANGGWGSSRNSWEGLPNVGFGAEGSHDATGGTVGGQVGYRWQAGTFVFGLEAQGNWADFSGSNVEPAVPRLPQPHQRRCVRSVHRSGRLCRQQRPALRQGRCCSDLEQLSRQHVAGGALAGVTGDDTRWGGTIGVGLEYAFAPNWSVGVEYNHLFMQDRTYTFTTPGGASSASIASVRTSISSRPA